MLKRFAILGIIAAAMLAVAPRAEAIPITGDIGFFGAADPQGGVGNLWSAGTTGINFGPALVGVTGGTGSFLGVTPLSPTSFTNFTFSPFPAGGIVPLWSFVQAGTTYSFNMLSVTTNFNAATQTFGLLGQGILNISGGLYNATPGTFVFSSQNGTPGPNFLFSSDASANPVPEPGSMMLLGSGLIGLATAARRRLANGRR